MAATNIITGTVANYTDTTANTLIATTKNDKQARADTEVANICTADWANKVDTDLTAINAVMRGAAGAYIWVNYQFAYTASATTAYYVPLAGSLSEANATSNYWARLPASYDGEIVSVSWCSNAATMGSTTVTTHVGTGADPSGTPLETAAAVNASAADTGYKATFSASTLTKGDLFAVKIAPTGNHEGVSGHVLVKYDTNT